MIQFSLIYPPFWFSMLKYKIGYAHTTGRNSRSKKLVSFILSPEVPSRKQIQAYSASSHNTLLRKPHVYALKCTVLIITCMASGCSSPSGMSVQPRNTQSHPSLLSASPNVTTPPNNKKTQLAKAKWTTVGHSYVGCKL